MQPRRGKRPTPKRPNAADAVASVARLLQTLGHAHLRARQVGRGIVIESGAEEDPFPHARLMPLPGDEWRLDVPTASGRWQAAAIGPRGNLIVELHQSFPWLLAPA